MLGPSESIVLVGLLEFELAHPEMGPEEAVHGREIARAMAQSAGISEQQAWAELNHALRQLKKIGQVDPPWLPNGELAIRMTISGRQTASALSRPPQE